MDVRLAELRDTATAAIAELADAASSLDESHPVDAVSLIIQLQRDLDVAMVTNVAALDQRGIGRKHRYPVDQFIADLHGGDRAMGRRWLSRARQLTPRTALTGEPLEPVRPQTAKAFEQREIGVAHADVIISALETRAGNRLTPEYRERAECELAEKAIGNSPQRLRKEALKLIDEYDFDGPDPGDGQRRTHLRLDSDPTGAVLRGELNAADSAVVRALLDALSKPDPAVDGEKDERTADERRGEALADLCRRQLDAGEVPDTGGEPPQVVITMTLQELTDHAATMRAPTLYGPEVLDAGQLRRLLCQAKVIPAVLGSDSQILDLGRGTRTVPGGLRRAVGLRDKGCAFPGCTAPPSHCEIHHIAEWVRDNGATALWNLVMLCGRHHALIHSTRNAGDPWIIRMVNGLPEFIPPRIVDPEQKPRANPRPPPAPKPGGTDPPRK